jgi:hypothetical protein
MNNLKDYPEITSNNNLTDYLEITSNNNLKDYPEITSNNNLTDYLEITSNNSTCGICLEEVISEVCNKICDCKGSVSYHIDCIKSYLKNKHSNINLDTDESEIDIVKTKCKVCNKPYNSDILLSMLKEKGFPVYNLNIVAKKKSKLFEKTVLRIIQSICVLYEFFDFINQKQINDYLGIEEEYIFGRFTFKPYDMLDE